MVVLRGLDALIEPTKDAVMEELAFHRDEAKFTERDENGLRQASGYVFYNTSEWTFQRLHDTAKPHVPETWINLDATKIGYEISFNKYFYCHKPLRSIEEEITTDILRLEEESDGLTREILSL